VLGLAAWQWVALVLSLSLAGVAELFFQAFELLVKQKRRCSKSGCSKVAVESTGQCKDHGGVRHSEVDGYTRSAMSAASSFNYASSGVNDIGRIYPEFQSAVNTAYWHHSCAPPLGTGYLYSHVPFYDVASHLNWGQWGVQITASPIRNAHNEVLFGQPYRAHVEHSRDLEPSWRLLGEPTVHPNMNLQRDFLCPNQVVSRSALDSSWDHNGKVGRTYPDMMGHFTENCSGTHQATMGHNTCIDRDRFGTISNPEAPNWSFCASQAQPYHVSVCN
jgi:hypothetical protein